MEKTYFKRKNLRLNYYDYTEPGYYFITICTNNKENYFGKVEDGRMIYTNTGKLAINHIEEIENIYDMIKIDKYIVMPNHIHLVLIIVKKTNINISRIIKQYKEKITKTIHKPIWQKSYYDHVIRNEKDYLRIWKYIDENVQKWELDIYYN
ncbi:MAG: transposase [Clostridia bacterium]|nr:transposase [Clostridia bacterium]